MSNRTSSTVGGVTTTYAYDNDDELTGTAGGFVNTYGYNANGDKTTRTLAGTSYTLTYDYDDQLTSASGSGFAYEAAGRRVSRTAGGVTTGFLYDGGAVLLERQGARPRRPTPMAPRSLGRTGRRRCSTGLAPSGW